jgi:hypothetical protein
MGAELFSAFVEKYAHDRGFGTILLDDGREIPFDVSVCTFEPRIGELVRVRLGVGRNGSLKVLYLEPAEAPEPEPTRLPIDAAIVRLHDAGIARSLGLTKLDALIDELYQGDDQEAEIVRLLARHYESEKADAVIDGWFACDWRFQKDTDDICRDLSDRVGDPALLTLIAIGERDATDSGFSERLSTLVARRFDGVEVERDIRSVLDVIALVNELLAERRDERRFRQIETDGDWYAFLLLTENTRERLATWRVLPIVPD